MLVFKDITDLKVEKLDVRNPPCNKSTRKISSRPV